jgi:hypothetical protein
LYGVGVVQPLMVYLLFDDKRHDTPRLFQSNRST